MNRLRYNFSLSKLWWCKNFISELISKFLTKLCLFVHNLDKIELYGRRKNGTRNEKMMLKFGAWAQCILTQIVVYLFSYLFTKGFQSCERKLYVCKIQICKQCEQDIPECIQGHRNIVFRWKEIRSIVQKEIKNPRTSSSGIWEMSPRSPRRWFHSKSLKARQDV